MLHTLYLLFIAPLEFLMRLVLEWGYSWTHSWGWSLVLLSLAVNTAILPIYNRAEGWQEDERALKRRMSRHEAMLRRTFRGQKRFFLLSALRRQFGYGYGFTLRASAGLLLQIPFFFAAYHLLSRFSPLSGQSFGFLPDLGSPDGLFSFGGFRVNVLPFLMTAANLASAFVYARHLSRRDKAQIYGIALLFLVLLYPAASALVLYWTLNNVYSLGKNIATKLWMRCGAGRGQEHCVKSVRGPVEGSIAYLWARWRSAIGSCFGVGILFWVYVCTLALSQRHNLLDSAFCSVMRHLAGQCILTAFLASLVLVTLIPPPFRRKSAWSSAFPALCAAVLFLLQFRFWGDAPGLGENFPFDLWDRSGLLWFGIWTLGIWLIGKFRDTLAGIAWKLGGFLLAGIAPAANGKTEEAPRPSNPATCALACFMGLICGIFLWYFIPFCSYLRNVNEFDFNGWELLWQLAPSCLMTVCVAASIFWGASRFPAAECIKLPLPAKAQGGARVGVIYVLALAFLFALLLEGSILSFGLPQLDGRQELFHSRSRMIVDLLVWLLIFLVFWKFRRYVQRNILHFTTILILISLSIFFDSLRSGDEKIDTRNFQTKEDLQTVSRNVLYSQLCYSRTQNVIVLLVDSIDTLLFEKTLELYPEFRKTFDGFWLFRENIGAGGLTYVSVPQILHGRTFADESFKDFVQESLVGKNSIASMALGYNSKVFIDTDIGYRVVGGCATQFEDIGDGSRSTDYLHRLFFRFIPYYAKHIVERRINFGNNNLQGVVYNNSNGQKQSIFSLDGDDPNKKRLNALIDRLDHIDERTVFQFIHFHGIHQPFVKEDAIQTTREFMKDLSQFFDALKKCNLFEKTTFIIMGDHGLNDPEHDHRKFYPERNGSYHTVLFPLFIIKTPESSGAMNIRDDLISSIYLKDILKNFYDFGMNNQVLDNYLSNLKENRSVYLPGSGKYEVTGTFHSLNLRKEEKKRTPLESNVIYALTPDGRYPYAYPVITKGDGSDIAFSLLGVRATSHISTSKVTMEFLCNIEKNSKKYVTFKIISYKQMGKLEIVDKISGEHFHWEKSAPLTMPCVVDEDGHMRFEFIPKTNIDCYVNYMIIHDKNDPIPEFPAF